MYVAALAATQYVGIVLGVGLRLFVHAHIPTGGASAPSAGTGSGCTNFAPIFSVVDGLAHFMAFSMIPLGIVGTGCGLFMTHVGYQQGSTMTKTSIIGMVFGLLAGLFGAVAQGYAAGTGTGVTNSYDGSTCA